MKTIKEIREELKDLYYSDREDEEDTFTYAYKTITYLCNRVDELEYDILAEKRFSKGCLKIIDDRNSEDK